MRRPQYPTFNQYFQVVVILLLIFVLSLPTIHANEIIADSFQFPLDRVINPTQQFGVYDNETFCGYHLATDLAAPAGTPVYAVATGKIKMAKLRV